MFEKLLARQFRKPSGLLGLYSTRFMLRRNNMAIAWTVELCGIHESDIVLEIGFGPGRGIEKAAGLLTSGKLYGLDFSKDMVKKASRYNTSLLRSGKVELTLGDLNPAPYPDNFFDKIFAVNVVYFWEQPARELAEIKRVLKPGGTMALYLTDKNSMLAGFTRTEVFSRYTGAEFRDIVVQAGFSRVGHETRDFDLGMVLRGHCIIAVK